jgi:serine/threonine protein phosphatase PrpC
MSVIKNEEWPEVMLVTAACATDRGRVRSGNEDAFVIFDLAEQVCQDLAGSMVEHKVGGPGLLLAVADGMGGASAGEIASGLAVEQLVRRLTAPLQKELLTDRLKDGLQSANRAIRRRSEENPELSGMGSTMTAAVLSRGKAVIGHVGDSRAYLIRNNDLRQITKDQSLVQLLVDIGQLTEEQAANSSKRNVILQALGIADEIEPEITTIELALGDRLLLCSDYLSRVVSDDELKGGVNRFLDEPQSACEHFVHLANERGGEDNITVILAQVA